MSNSLLLGHSTILAKSLNLHLLPSKDHFNLHKNFHLRRPVWNWIDGEAKHFFNTNAFDTSVSLLKVCIFRGPSYEKKCND